MTEGRLVTADELMRESPPHKRTELVHGRLVVREPAGARHGGVAARLTHRLMTYLDTNPLGRIYAAETGFHIGQNPDLVRAPDVAFVSHARLAGPDPADFPRVAPDLVVEILSPGDRAGDVLQKVGQWLAAGSRLVWVLDPQGVRARIYRADGSQATVGPEGSLDGEDVLPEFECGLIDVSPGPLREG